MNDAGELMDRARAAADRSYSPYSRFRVGAVAVSDDGREFIGVNVENAAYGSSICAEANAITTAVTAGVRKINTVAVACLDGEDCYPCGDCRQLLREFDVERVIVQDPAGGYREHPASDLLPHSFGADSLPPR